jgi:WD40 repeat protein
MSLPRSLLPAVLGIVLVPLSSPGAGGAPAHEPLPAGAVGRLGSACFRMPSHYDGAALSPDGRVLAVHEWPWTLLLLDTRTGKVRKRLEVRSGSRSMRYTSDGKKVVSCSYEDGVSVVDLVTGSEQHWRLAESTRREVTPLFSTDGKYMAQGYGNYIPGGLGYPLPRGVKSIKVWDLTTRKMVHELSPPTEWAGAALSADGKRLASWDSALQIWDLASEKVVRRIDVGPCGISFASFSPDGKHLAVIEANRMKSISVWELATGKRLHRLVARRDTVPPLVYSPNGKFLAAGSQDGLVQVWDLTTGERLGVAGGPRCELVSVALTDKGRGLAVGMYHETLCVWELPTGKMRTPLTGHRAAVTCLAFLAGGKTLYSGGRDGIYWWDVASQKTTRHWTSPDEYRFPDRGDFARFLISPDGRYLASIPGRDGMVSFLDPGTLHELFAVPTHQYDDRGPMSSFSRVGSCALVREVKDKGGIRHLLTIWDVAKGRRIRDIELGYVFDAVQALSPDGRLVALANNANRPDPTAKGLPPQTVGIWEVSTGKRIASLGSGEGLVMNLAFAPDSHSLVAVKEDGWVGAWEVGSDEWVALEQVPLSPTSHIAFSPDGRTFAVAGSDRESHEGEVGVWEVATGKLRVRYRGHRGEVQALAFSPDGRLLASGGADTTVLLWDRLRRPGEKLPAKGLEGVWADLNAPDPVRGHRALLRLLADPEKAVALLSRQLEPKAGKQVEGALKAALASGPGPEKHRRLEELLKRLAGGRRAPERVGPRRALEVLERLATPSAERLLETLGKSRPRTWLAKEAAESLRRLRARR